MRAQGAKHPRQQINGLLDMSLRRSRFVEGEVERIARGGDGVLRTPEGPVFVALSVVGDRLRVKVTGSGKARRGYLRAVLRPGPARRPSPCDLAERCGGCPWIVMDETAQRTLKRSRLERALPSPAAEVTVTSAEDLGYRCRARLAWGRGRVGFRVRRSAELCDVTSCVVLAPAVDAAIAVVRALPLEGQGEVWLALRDGRPVAILSTDDPQAGEVYRACEEAVNRGDLAGLLLRVAGAEARWGDPAAERRLGFDGEPIEGAVGGFSQAHGTLNLALVAYVHEQARPEGSRVLELFCGSGNLSVALAAGAAEFWAVEANAEAADACLRNLRGRGLEGRVSVADANQPPLMDADVVVLDPPRVGAEEAVRALAGRRKLRRIVYVSCHLGSLERDLRILAEAGWRVGAARGFDMFPQTPHLESVVTLVRG